jgi:hypothetical protein
VLRCALPSIGIPLGVPPGPPAATAGAALLLMPGSAEPTWLNAGADEAQLCGTDIMPTVAARPTPAATCALLIPGAPKTLVPEPKPSPTANPNVWKWPPNPPAVGPTDDMNELAGPIAEMPEVDIDTAEPVPDTRLVPDVSAVDEVVHDDSDDDSGVVDTAEVSGADTAELSGADTAEVSGVDTAEVSGVDTAEVSGVDTAEVSGADTAELSGADTAELSGAAAPELTGADTAELTGADTAELTGADTAEVSGDTV